MSEIRIRRMNEADVEPGIELVLTVFNEFVASDLPPKGIVSFTEWANPTAFSERLREGCLALVAVERDRIVGVIEWMPPNHVAMLFVDPTIQGEGVGRRLFEEALRRSRAVDQDAKAIRVHASRYAVSFYRRLGFRESGPEQEQDGIRYTPMLLEIEG